MTAGKVVTGFVLVIWLVVVPVVLIAHERVRKANVLVPSLVIGIPGGLANAYFTARLGYAAGPMNYVLTMVLMVMVMMAGLHVAEKGNLPRLWPPGGGMTRLPAAAAGVGFGVL